MIAPVEDHQEWASRYQISLEPMECPVCKNKITPTKPIAINGYRGLAVADHGCGSGGPARLVPVGREKLAFWEQFRPEHKDD